MTWEAEDFTGGIALEEDTKAWEAQENIVLDHFERLQVPPLPFFRFSAGEDTTSSIVFFSSG